MKINLVENGIFPITKDKDGNDLNQSLDTGLMIAGTIQGEGMYLGTPSLFIRTSGCNLRCSWVGTYGDGSPCDTPYSSHNPEKNLVPIEDVVSTVRHNIGNMDHVVITGGEPMMQGTALVELCKQLKGFRNDLVITIETNATIFVEGLSEYVDLYSMSPKLKSSTPWEPNLKNTGIEYDERKAKRHEKQRRNLTAIAEIIEDGLVNNALYQLKFVISGPEDVEELITDFWEPLKKKVSAPLNSLMINEDVFLMPEGIHADELATKHIWVSELAIKHGFRFTPRLHAMIFGIARGV